MQLMVSRRGGGKDNLFQGKIEEAVGFQKAVALK